jgi:uncharacterized membrane protein YtjA (UPF0391 family)
MKIIRHPARRDGLTPPDKRNGRFSMLSYALIFLGVAIVAGLFGFTGISLAASDIARVLFFIFLVLFAVSLIFGLRGQHNSVLDNIFK